MKWLTKWFSKKPKQLFFIRDTKDGWVDIYRRFDNYRDAYAAAEAYNYISKHYDSHSKWEQYVVIEFTPETQMQINRQFDLKQRGMWPKSEKYYNDKKDGIPQLEDSYLA